MEKFREFLDNITDPAHRARTEEILNWVHQTFPGLQTRVAWGQPAFTDHGTFIFSVSLARQHLAVAPETKTLRHFAEDIREAGYETTQMLMRLPWNKPVNYDLLKKIIAFNIEDKKDVTTYWRRAEDWK